MNLQINPRYWLLSAIGVVICSAAAYCQIHAVEPKPFFATERASRASSVAGAQSLRVSHGSERPSIDLKRDFEGKVPVPANEVPGLREVPKTTNLTFRAFRNFGTQRSGAGGATRAAGAPLPQR